MPMDYLRTIESAQFPLRFQATASVSVSAKPPTLAADSPSSVGIKLSRIILLSSTSNAVMAMRATYASHFAHV
ncbi:hypothetical protein SAMN05216567_12129 [Variovorax sp. OK605]|nr:hypothetical protein SAMN05216567_12129 [Variovorax sp. OK605]